MILSHVNLVHTFKTPFPNMHFNINLTCMEQLDLFESKVSVFQEVSSQKCIAFLNPDVNPFLTIVGELHKP
jgi:hypothetical protein